MATTTKFIGTGIVTAIAASLCCITPLLAFISGATGVASSLSWMEPFRPYLIGITILVLGISWYQKLKIRNAGAVHCDCDDDEKPSFFQSKIFLGLVTVFAISMLFIPYYGGVLYPNVEKAKVIIVSPENIVEVTIPISDMTCASCEVHIKNSIYELDGIISAKVDYKSAATDITFDRSKTNIKALYTQIKKAGFTPKETQ